MLPMIRKKVLDIRMKQRRITRRSCNSTSVSTVLIALLLAGLSSIKVISSCVISPSEFIAIAGDLSSFTCNARPNNTKLSSIEFIKLGSDGASGTDIFRPPAYNSKGNMTKKLVLAEGYFLSHLDEDQSYVIIQINETQLKHGGQYFCSCRDLPSTLGTANFTILDKLSFVRSGDEDLKPGAPADLSCSVSFNGSTSSAFIDLTISGANGTQVSAAKNLSLISSVTGHHVIQYKVVANPKEEQGFTCEVKVWNKSSTGESPLRSMTSNFSLNWDPTSTPSLSKGRTAFIAVVVIAALLLVAVLIVISIGLYKKFHTRSTGNATVSAHSAGQKSPSTNQDNIRYKDVRPSNQHPSPMMPQYPEDKGERNKAMANSDVVVFDNVIYEASSDCYKTEQPGQIYNEIL